MGTHLLLTSKAEVLNHRIQHFNNTQNLPSYINEEAINRLPKVPTHEALDNTPTPEEIHKAIHQISNGTSPAADAIYLLRSLRMAE